MEGERQAAEERTPSRAASRSLSGDPASPSLRPLGAANTGPRRQLHGGRSAPYRPRSPEAARPAGNSEGEGAAGEGPRRPA